MDNRANLGADSLAKFLNKFGKDPVGEAFIEVLLEELMHAKIICILGQQEQKGDQVSDGTQGKFGHNGEADQSKNIKTPPNLGESDSTTD